MLVGIGIELVDLNICYCIVWMDGIEEGYYG